MSSKKRSNDEKTSILIDDDIRDEIETLMGVFDQAKQRVYYLMERDSHRRFIVKPQIRNLLAGEDV